MFYCLSKPHPYSGGTFKNRIVLDCFIFWEHFLYLLFVTLCMCMCVYMCVCTCVCVCVCTCLYVYVCTDVFTCGGRRSTPDTRSPSCFLTQSTSMNLELPGSRLVGAKDPPVSTAMRTGANCHAWLLLGCWRSKIRSSCLCGKNLTDWAIFPAPLYISYRPIKQYSFPPYLCEIGLKSSWAT